MQSAATSSSIERLDDLVQRAGELGAAALQDQVVVVDDLVLDDDRPAGLAVRAAQLELPVARAGLLPVHGLDESQSQAPQIVRSTAASACGGVAAAGPADLDGRGRGLVEVHDLDRAAGRQGDLADRVVRGVVVVAHDCVDRAVERVHRRIWPTP